MDMESEQTFPGLCKPLPETPHNSPNPKKIRTETSEDGADNVSNADILKAIHGLNDRFSKFEEMVKRNTAEIGDLQEHMKDLGMQCKTTDDNLKKVNEQMTAIQERQEEAERYSRRWNLRLLNLPEHGNEDVRKEVMGIIAQIVPEEKSRLGFLVDTVHRVGGKKDDNKPRPIIMQFTMRNFRHKVWRASLNSDVLKTKNLRMAEDLTYTERQCRNKLWPLVKQARDEGKKTKWIGPIAIIDGVRHTA